MNTQTDLVQAVYTTEACQGVSPKYRQIKTIDVVNYLTDLGWIPRLSSNYSCRDGDPIHCKHFVRFSQEAEAKDVDLQLTVVNSHDRSVPFRLLVGFMCKGSTIPFIATSSPVYFMNTRHIGKAPDHLKDNITSTLAYLPEVAASISQMCDTQVTENEARDMAVAIADLRWPGKGSQVASLFRKYNYPDGMCPSLFTVYCDIQTQVLLGGYRMSTRGIKRPHATARAIKSFKRQVAIGQACWAIAMNILSNRALLDAGSLNISGENVTW